MSPTAKAHPVTHGDLVEMRTQLVALREELIGRMDKEGSRIDGLFAEHDTRYGQRFDAQERALNAALVAAEKTVTAALAATKESNAAAQAAADRAVQKAEVANEQRFSNIVEKLDALSAQVGLISGTGTGLKAGWQYLIAALAAASILYNLIGAIAKP
jgi:hypothetical protein